MKDGKNKWLDDLVGGRKVWTHWQWYKSFFSVTIFRYFVTFFALVPIFAKVLNQIPKHVNLFGYNVNITLPFKWELLWMSAVSFVFAYLLYVIFCPKFIKEYSSFGDYKRHMHSPRWLVWLAYNIVKNYKDQLPRFFERMKTKKYFAEAGNIPEEVKLPDVKVQEQQTVLYFKYEEQLYLFGMPIIDSGQFDSAKTEVAEYEIFWEIFGRFSSSQKIVRLVIISLLFVSASLFVIVLTQNIFAGVQYMFN